MTTPMNFSEARKAYLKTLKLYAPVVARVHGEHHPEFHEVREQFDSMVVRMSEAGRKRPQLEEEFQKLRLITANYEVPGDVCESYEAVYRMLLALDQAYHA